MKRCPPKQTLAERPLLTAVQANSLMSVFKVLANDTRLRLLHSLARSGELCVNEIAAALEMKPQAISNQLQRLVDRGILGCRRTGNHVRYRIIDQCMILILEQGLCLSECTETRLPLPALATSGSPSPEDVMT